ncbi:MAG: VWA domain-containing protein [Muribaculaceae bacterium]|nr:VWA domain-containing protein [Muribaculaceae bacterium]
METKKMKVYNVIILDKSGSMSSIARQAVDGVNETIGSIKSAQEKNPDQEHIVTLVAFCGCELKTIYDNTPVAEVKPLTERDYRPCCMTPLYDAIGTTISRVHTLKTQDPESLALVTIITDGYENASHEFTHQSIRALIESYKEQGWQFTYIGADHDVESVSFSLSIDHHMKFDKTEAGTRAMFDKASKSRDRWFGKISMLINECGSVASPKAMKKLKDVNSEEYFDED